MQRDNSNSKERFFDVPRIVDGMVRRYLNRLALVLEDQDKQLKLDPFLAECNLELSAPFPLLTMNDFLDVAKVVLASKRIEGLGLKVGKSLKFSDYGVLGMALASCATLAEALRLDVYFFPLESVAPEVKITTKTAAGRYIYRYEEEHRQRKQVHYLVEHDFAGILSGIQQTSILTDEEFHRGCRVKLAYPRPAYWRLYEKILGCPVSFNQEISEFSFPESWLKLELDTANPELSLMLEKQIKQVLDKMGREGGLIDQTRSLILSSSGPPPSLDEAAAQMGLSRDSFRRRLYEAETSYRKVVLQTRMQLAKEYLRDSILSLQEISFLLGYEHVSNFCHAFKKHFGETPMEFRGKS